MKKIENKWIDENNNSWCCDKFTEDQAINYSKTLINCSDCSDCSSCSFCSDCSDCRDCRDCRGCRGCSNYIKNPNRYAQKGIGSSWGNTCIYWDVEQKNIQVICGCFRGNIEAFEKAVLNKYDSEHGYIEFIKIVKVILKMENNV